MTGTKRVVGSLHLISTVTRQVTYVPGRCRTASLESSRSPDPSLSAVSLHHEHKLCQCKGDKGPVTGVTRTILPCPSALCEWHSQVLSPVEQLPSDPGMCPWVPGISALPDGHTWDLCLQLKRLWSKPQGPRTEEQFP